MLIVILCLAMYHIYNQQNKQFFKLIRTIFFLHLNFFMSIPVIQILNIILL